MAYADLRAYIAALEASGLLHRVRGEINKDTELMPLVRWQFRGLAPEQRKAFLFEQVTDSRQRRFSGGVATAIFAPNRAVYAAAVGCDPSQVGLRWAKALQQPIEPRVVPTGPVKEVIIKGDDLSRSGGVDALPHPISTPGFDPAPFLTSASWVSRDPETGAYNLGVYRGMVKAPDRLGLQLDTPSQHLAVHIRKARSLGRNLEVAVVLGAVPAVSLASVAKVAYGVSEYAVAGGLVGEPIELVNCESIDLAVPATAEIVMEGVIETESVEPEGPFGEASGFMGPRSLQHFLRIRCITHRKNPITTAFVSEIPPSESTLMRRIAFENIYLHFLRDQCNIPSVKKVAFHESSSCNMMFVIQLQDPAPGQAWQALRAAVAFDPSMGKFIVAVDADIDPADLESVVWALSFRSQPHRDVSIMRGKVPRLDPSAAPPDASDADKLYPDGEGSSALLIDATRPWSYPPTSLPSRDFMENARQLWDAEGLPALQVREPWHGYELGDWPDEHRKEALLAIAGHYLQTGDKLAQLRQKIKGS